jgi:peptidoglycan/LPS O-acetylase OafA/YrhL
LARRANLYFVKFKVDSLTSTRAFAAILVVIHHFGRDVFPFKRFPGFFGNGNLAVSYFFVLSGFVMYNVYADKDLSYKDFIVKRVARIVPVYYLALLLFISLPILLHQLPNDFTKQLFIHVLFLQAYIPGYALTLNGPAWTLSVEMFFYCLFPALLLFQKKNNGGFIVSLIVLFICSQAIHLWYSTHKYLLSDDNIDLVYFNPLIHLNQFLIGMAGGRFYQKTKGKTNYVLMPLLLLCALFLLIIFRPENLSYQTGLIAPVFMLFIVSVAKNDPPILNIKPLVVLGEISYGIYILQVPVFAITNYMNSQYFQLRWGYFFYASLLLLILISFVSYYLIEKPLRKWISGVNH